MITKKIKKIEEEYEKGGTRKGRGGKKRGESEDKGYGGVKMKKKITKKRITRRQWE